MLFQNICSNQCFYGAGLLESRKKSNKNEIKYMYALRPNAAYLNSQCHTCMLQNI